MLGLYPPRTALRLLQLSTLGLYPPRAELSSFLLSALHQELLSESGPRTKKSPSEKTEPLLYFSSSRQRAKSTL